MNDPALIARQIKVPEPLHHATVQHAATQNRTVTAVVIDYITRYAAGAEHPQPAVKFANGNSVAVPEDEVSRYPSRTVPTVRLSFRIDSQTWEAAMNRATENGTVLAAVVNRFLRGYTAQAIN